MKKLKEMLPSFNAWEHTSGVSITPHFSINYSKYQGKTSEGCVKWNVQLGWLIWTCQLLWKHKPRPEPEFVLYCYEDK